MADQFQVLILNNISQNGLKRLPAERFHCAKDVAKPDAILLRSADLHSVEIAKSVMAIGRAGSGTNNIPVGEMTKRGVPVFNAPGANANAVKELVLAGMLLAARNIGGAMKFVTGLDPKDPEMEKKVEDGKKTFAGFEISGHTLGVVGLGKIGCLVADAAIKLGMNVVGYDPEITVDAAWSLPSQVRSANSLGEVLKSCNFITLHVPLVDATRKMINAGSIEQMKHGAVLLNFSREGVVDEAAVLAALGCEETGLLCLRLPQSRCQCPCARDRLAAPWCFDARSRGKLRHHGRRPGARLHARWQHRQFGEFPECDDAAGISLPAGDRQRQRAEHGRPDLDGDGRGQAQHPQHDEQVEEGCGLYPGRCRQQGA
jgi:D-3-phosphoglycerate dehydrogenase